MIEANATIFKLSGDLKLSLPFYKAVFWLFPHSLKGSHRVGIHTANFADFTLDLRN
jgi:hypothetical protein